MNDSPFRVVILDDDQARPAVSTHPDAGVSTRAILETHGCEVICCEDYGQASIACAQRLPDLLMLDANVGGFEPLRLVHAFRQRFPELRIVLTAATASVEQAVEAMRSGVFDVLAKPIDPPRLRRVVERAMRERRPAAPAAQSASRPADEAGFDGMVGICPQMREVYRLIEQVAPTDVSVMVLGETGTGKEMVAKAIHRRSRRAHAALHPVNMAAIPRELAEATLFGHEKGAFTGADRTRAGICEEAHGGTLFLDEIGELPIDLQPKLLRFLQDRRFRRVGSSRALTSDARIISATNRDPAAEVRAGRLRADLFYRLNVVTIHLPPLRQRRGDIPLLARHAMRQSSLLHGRNFEAISEEALRMLIDYDWPGNVRELFHVIERAVVLHDGGRIEAHMLHGGLQPRTAARPAEGDPVSELKIVPLPELERRAIEAAVTQCEGSAAEAARRLGISQATIYRKLKAYGLPPRPRPRRLPWPPVALAATRRN